MPASRVREMLDGCKLKNELRPGFWNYADDSGAGFRLVNQTSECSGRPLVLVTDSLAYPPDPALGLGPAPADIVEAEGLVTLVVSKGTLVPQGHLSRGVLARTKSCNAAGKRALTVNPDDLKAIKKPQSHLGMSAGAAHASSLAPGQMVYGPPRQMPMAMATGMSLVGMPVATAYPVTTLQPRAMQPSAPCASAQQPHSAFSESTQSIAIARWQQATSLHSGNAVGAPNPPGAGGGVGVGMISVTPSDQSFRSQDDASSVPSYSSAASTCSTPLEGATPPSASPPPSSRDPPGFPAFAPPFGRSSTAGPPASHGGDAPHAAAGAHEDFERMFLASASATNDDWFRGGSYQNPFLGLGTAHPWAPEERYVPPNQTSAAFSSSSQPLGAAAAEPTGAILHSGHFCTPRGTVMAPPPLLPQTSL